MHGRGYVIDHCVAAFFAEQKERLYRIYITDSLQAIVENTALRFPFNAEPFKYGQEISSRWLDLAEGRQVEEPKEDTRTCAEIVSGIWSRMRGETK